MGVGVEGDVDVGMSQTFLHHLGADAGLDQQGSVGVTKIVETDVREIMLLEKALPFFCYGVRTVGITVLFVDHVAQIPETGFGFVDKVLHLCIAEQGGHIAADGDITATGITFRGFLQNLCTGFHHIFPDVDDLVGEVNMFPLQGSKLTATDTGGSGNGDGKVEVGIGSSHENFSGGMNHYDADGEITGSSHGGFWGEINHFDVQGEKVGESVRNFSGGYDRYSVSDKEQTEFWQEAEESQVYADAPNVSERNGGRVPNNSFSSRGYDWLDELLLTVAFAGLVLFLLGFLLWWDDTIWYIVIFIVSLALYIARRK